METVKQKYNGLWQVSGFPKGLFPSQRCLSQAIFFLEMSGKAMSKIRLCKFCRKDIASEWPRLKKVCDEKECRDKQYHEHVLAVRERDRKQRLKRKAAKPRICKVCKKPLPISQHASKKTCPECKEKWEAEVKRKAAIRVKKVLAIDKEPKLECYVPRPGDFCQAVYEQEQVKLNKPNGRMCVVCGQALVGYQNPWCQKCRAVMFSKADVVRTDGGFEYDQAGGPKHNWTLVA